MPESLTRSRLDSFSDGVIAVIITIMVLELKVPSVHEMGAGAAIQANLKILAVYLLSFVQTGIYWVNHHYLLDDLETVSHGVLWANLTFLFTLSLIPFGVQWIGIRGVTAVPVAVYAVCFLLPALTWSLLAHVIAGRTGIPPAAGPLKQAFSSAMTLLSIPVAFLSPLATLAMIAIVASIWLVPPRRILDKTRPRIDGATAEKQPR